jgi:arabinofuranan 3-O-arabinosyltransferase
MAPLPGRAVTTLARPAAELAPWRPDSLTVGRSPGRPRATLGDRTDRRNARRLDARREIEQVQRTASRWSPAVRSSCWLVGLLAGAAVTVRQLVHAAHAPSIDFVHVWSATHQLIGTGNAYGDPLFTYPPSAALLLSPLGLSSYPAARTGMLVVNVVAVAVAGLLLARELGARIGPRGVALLLVAVGGLDAVASTWANGNINGVLILLEVLALRWLLRGKAMPAAVVVGVSLALKPVLLPLLALFLVRRHWRALGVAVCIPLVLNVIGAVVVSDATRYPTVVLPYLMRGAQLPYNDSLVGLGYRCGLSAGVVLALRIAVAVGAVVLYARCAFGRTRLDARSRLFAEVAIGLSATFLVSPISETYYTLFLLPAVAWLATTSRRAAAALAGVTVLCFATLRLTGIPNDVHRSVSVLALRPTIGWLALAALCAAAVLARPRTRLRPQPAGTFPATTLRSRTVIGGSHALVGGGRGIRTHDDASAP